MKKIIVLMGSPRKGETYKAVQKFEEELKMIEPIEMETVFLNKIGFPDCLGCHNCILKGEGTCYQAEKVKGLVDKINNADGVIMATPVYNQHVTAIMKKFLDYLTFLWHRPAMFGKVFMGISSGGGMFKDVFKFLKSNVESWGGVWAEEFGVPHYDALTPKFQAKVDKDFPKKARSFMMAMNSKDLPSPSINRLMMFNIWKMNAIACKGSNPADFAYWTKNSWLEKDYYYNTKIGPIKGIFVKFAVMMAKSFMKKVYVGY
jgi:multimeric flavodoxin WrbA